MDRNNPTHAQWLNRVAKAFAGITLEGGIGYFEGHEIYWNIKPGTPEYEAGKAKDGGTSWQEPLAFIMSQNFPDDWVDHDILYYMDTQGIRYYLPVFLSLDLFHELLENWIVFHLKAPFAQTTTSTPEWQILESLTQDQQQCLLDLFRHRYEVLLERAQTPYLCTCGNTHIPWQKFKAVSPQDYLQDTDEERAFHFLEAWYRDRQLHLAGTGRQGIGNTTE